MRKKLDRFDFLAINRIMNGNYNGGDNLLGPTKKITKGEELEMLRKLRIKNSSKTK